MNTQLITHCEKIVGTTIRNSRQCRRAPRFLVEVSLLGKPRTLRYCSQHAMDEADFAVTTPIPADEQAQVRAAAQRAAKLAAGQAVAAPLQAAYDSALIRAEQAERKVAEQAEALRSALAMLECGNVLAAKSDLRAALKVGA